MIDWGALVVGPTVEVFGEEVVYSPSPSSVIYTGSDLPSLTAVFDNGYTSVGTYGDQGVTSSSPRFGIQLSAMPPGYDPKNAQDDMITLVRTGEVFVVKTGEPDSHGWARLDCNLRHRPQ